MSLYPCVCAAQCIFTNIASYILLVSRALTYQTQRNFALYTRHVQGRDAMVLWCSGLSFIFFNLRCSKPTRSHLGNFFTDQIFNHFLMEHSKLSQLGVLPIAFTDKIIHLQLEDCTNAEDHWCSFFNFNFHRLTVFLYMGTNVHIYIFKSEYASLLKVKNIKKIHHI